MKKMFTSIISLVLIFSIFITGCAAGSQIKKVKNHWNIPENEDIKITLINGDQFEFQKGEYKVFNDAQVVKGLGIKVPVMNQNEISQVVIPIGDIQAIEILNERTYQYFLTAGIVGGIGVLVYFLLQK